MSGKCIITINQLKDNRCKPSNVLEQREKSFTRHYELH